MPPICRILLAEDNPTNQKVALLQLRKIGFDAETANNGAEVLELCRTRAYDVILMDCLMPVMDGYEATRALRARAREVPPRTVNSPRIIALTANALRGDREKCLAAGMDDYISKPVSLNELREAIIRNWQKGPGAPAEPPMPVRSAPLAPLINLERFNSVCRDAAGKLDPEAFGIFSSAMMELPSRWDRLARSTGLDLSRDAHQLKGMVAVFGFVRTAELLAQLEAEAHRLTPPEVVARVSVLRSTSADTITELTRLVPDLEGA